MAPKITIFTWGCAEGIKKHENWALHLADLLMEDVGNVAYVISSVMSLMYIETLGLGMNWVRLNQIRIALVDKTCLWIWMYAKYFSLDISGSEHYFPTTDG